MSPPISSKSNARRIVESTVDPSQEMALNTDSGDGNMQRAWDRALKQKSFLIPSHAILTLELVPP